jgi:hypothetical protein
MIPGLSLILLGAITGLAGAILLWKDELTLRWIDSTYGCVTWQSHGLPGAEWHRRTYEPQRRVLRFALPLGILAGGSFLLLFGFSLIV